MVINLGRRNLTVKKLTAALLLAVILLGSSLFLLQLTVLAGFKASGAGGCGNFDESIDLAQDGDTVALMTPDANTNGKLITKNILLHGGWAPPENGCDTQEVYTNTTDLEQAGFVFLGSLSRSVLTGFDGSSLKIDPAVLTLTIQNVVIQNFDTLTPQGGGISGVISNGARVRLDNVVIDQGLVTDAGGGIYLEVRGGSRLVIADSQIIGNGANTGGGFEIAVYDGSEVIIENTLVASNSAGTGNGGGGRIRIVDSGYVTITNSSFQNNSANGSGNDLAIESENGGPAYVWLLNSPLNSGALFSTGGGLTVYQLETSLYLPVAVRGYSSSAQRAQINDIQIEGDHYSIDYETNYPQSLPGDHVHFFFNTVPPERAGTNLPGANSNNWRLYAGPSPFTGYSLLDRPVGAWQMCILVANEHHVVSLGSGNCVHLP